MPGNSNKAAYNGTTSRKPKHYFSDNPQTCYPGDEGRLRNYRLDEYKNGLSSVPFANIQARDPNTIQTTHQARVTADLNAILSRLSYLDHLWETPTRGIDRYAS
ncbi:hypothetical protein F4776DRAFT_623149 [Hypoxylon sp. NC0597]|nr:hypothetical protein F4776DRAFT_623149 [Hypoxylon sp. NC0597]